MSANSINVPFPIFNDVDGDPLDAGYIYIGTANLDAETNPINVYFNEELTVPAPQPIRTLNGFPSNSGTPTRIYVDKSDFSITVRNKNSTLVYTSSNLTEKVSSSIVTFKQSGNGSVNTTAETKFKEIVSATDFGCVCDGVTDDTEKLQNALDSGARKVLLPNNTSVTSLNVPTGVILEGLNRLTTIVLTTTNGITIGTDGENFYGGLRNIKVQITQDGTIGIDTTISSNNAVLDGIFVESFPATNGASNTTIGIKFNDDASSNHGFWINAQNIIVKDCALGVYFATNDTRVFGLNILSCYKALKFDAAHVNIFGGNFEFLGGTGSDVIDQTSGVMSNVHFYGCRAENMGAWTIPALAVDCSVHDYRLVGTLLKNYDNTTLISSGNMFRDGITMSNRVEGVADTTGTPSKLSVAYTSSSSSGIGTNDGSFQFNRVLSGDGDTADFGYFRYRGATKTVGVNGLNRTTSSNPTGFVTPRYTGEEMLDTVNKIWYKSTGTNPADWRALN